MASDKCEQDDIVSDKRDDIANDTNAGDSISDNVVKSDVCVAVDSSSEVKEDSVKIELKEVDDASQKEEQANKTSTSATSENNTANQESNNSITKQENEKSETTENDEKTEAPTDPGKMDPAWDGYILAVKGILPIDLGALKKLLVNLLGANRHRIRPRQKDDQAIYVHFKCVDDMRGAQKALHNQTFLNKKITANIIKFQPPAPGSSRKNTATQKLGSWFNFADETYEQQVKIKMADLQSKLEHVEKTIGKAYPMYSALLKKRKLKYNGTFCPVDPMKTCPTDQRNLQTVYRFTIGISEIGQYGIGFFGKKIKSISSTNLSCPEHVIEAANVFEKMLQVPVEPTAIFSRWKKLIIHTNRAKDLMVTVFGKCPKEVETEELKRSHDVLKEYYTNGEGKECKIASLHMKIVKDELILGVPYIEETMDNLIFPLLPRVQLWNYVEGAEMLYKTIETLMELGKESTVLTVGCSILIALHLAKVAAKVMLNPMPSIEMAKKYAEKNNITNFEYFECDWTTKISFEDFAEKIKYDDFCAIFNLTLKSYSPSSVHWSHLRKMEKLKKILVIEMNTTADVTFPLIVPSVGTDTSKPFFPSRIIPLDLLPNSKTYVKLTLFERIDQEELTLIQKNVGLEKSVNNQKNLGLGKTMPYNKKIGAGKVVTPSKKQKNTGIGNLMPGKLATTSKKTPFKKPYERQYSQPQRGWGDFRSSNLWDQTPGMFQNIPHNQFEMQRPRVGGSWNFPLAIEEEQEIVMQMQRRHLAIEHKRREVVMQQKLEEEIRSQIGRDNWRHYSVDEDHRGGIGKTEERLRELERVKCELKDEFGVLRNLLKDTLREAAIPQLKDAIAEAIRSAGIVKQDVRPSDADANRVGAPEVAIPQLKDVIAEAIRSAGIVSQETRPSDASATGRGVPKTYRNAGNPQRFQDQDSSHLNQNIASLGNREYPYMGKDRQYPGNWKQSNLTREQEVPQGAPPSLLSLKLKRPPPPTLPEANETLQAGGYSDYAYQSQTHGTINRNEPNYRNLPERDINIRSNEMGVRSSHIHRPDQELLAQREFRGDQFRDQEIGSSSMRGQNYNPNYNRDVNVQRVFDNDPLYDRVERDYIQKYPKTQAGIRDSESYIRRGNVADLLHQGDNRYMQEQTYSQLLPTPRSYNSSMTYDQEDTNKMLATRNFENNAKRIKLDNTVHQGRFSGYASESKPPLADKHGRYLGW
ncbi:uncharacterized protein [Periplaneta americana]|uniref:uncharacterized protein n=1 Tax=Periplaneta americana TaxID=6978 RepID=UPI0037E9C84C